MPHPLYIYTSQYSLKHDTGVGHPENTNRIDILMDLFAEDCFEDVPLISGDMAELEQVMLAHNEDYIFKLQDMTPEQGFAAIDGDTILCPDSYNAALFAAGTACQAVDNIVGNVGDSRRAFVAVRPPGHHAEPNTAMGFCLFNNVFIAARHAQTTHHIQKIIILDFDVHHGNGTETMCRRHNKEHPESPILYISSHGHPLFPMTGDPAENDATTFNLRLPENCDSEAFRDLYTLHILPLMDAFAPDLIMLSSGFDAHKDDPLAPINLESEDYGWLTQEVVKIADKHCEGRIISVLEGGYHLDALKESVAAHLLALMHDNTLEK